MKRKMISLAGLAVTAIMFFLGTPEPRQPAANKIEGFEAGIGRILAHPSAEGSVIGISIRDAADGTILYSHNGDARLQPASGMKLVTAASALHILGSGYRFSTELYADGEQTGDTLDGNLYLKGKGDPTLQPNDFAALAEELKKRGVRTINGNLVGDDGWYDAERLSVDLPWSDEEHYYGAPISALTASFKPDYDAATVDVRVDSGGEAGAPVKVRMTPANPFMQISSTASTGGPESKQTLKVTRVHGTERIQITGTLPVDSKGKRFRLSVSDPTGYAMSLFEMALEEKGIAYTGKMMRKEVPAGGQLVARNVSEPLSDLLIPFMKLSNNTIAEGLVKEIGRAEGDEGSWPEGLAIIEGRLEQLGMNPESIKMRDGSGLSPLGMVSANNLSSLLYHVQAKPWFPMFERSLPIAGIKGKLDGGTLRNRMAGTAAEGNVIAKTGTITFNSSLSGYVTAKNGKKMIFSIIINNGLNEKKLKGIEDQLAVWLAEQTN